MWADVMVDKVSTTLHLDQNKDKHTGSVSFYLLPAVSEYCLLSAALIYEITVRIGQPSYIELEDEEESENGSDLVEAEDEDYSDEDVSEEEEEDSVETPTEDEHRRKGSADTTSRDREATDVSSSKSSNSSDPELAIKRIRRKKGRSPERPFSRVFAKHVRKVSFCVMIVYFSHIWRLFRTLVGLKDTRLFIEAI